MFSRYRMLIREWTERLPDGDVKRIAEWLSFKIAVAFSIMLLALIAFAKIANEVRENETTQFDTGVLMSIQHFMHTQFLDTVVPVITNFGGTIGIAIGLLMTVGAFMYKKQVSRAAIVFTGVGGAVAINLVLKNLFGRVRPELWDRLVIENGYSSPSGHSMASSALALSIIAALWYTRWRVPATVIGAVYVLVIGLTRLYLGVHYPTDVIGGWMMSLAWVVAVFMVFRPKLHNGAQ